MRQIFYAIVGLCLALTACGEGSEPAAQSSDNGAVNLFSSRHYDTDLRLYSDFTARTGIKVNRIEANADALIARISAEGEFSPADLLITVDAGRLWRAQEAGILAPVQSQSLNARVPESLRHPDGLWFGLSKRARVIIYNKKAGKPAPLETYQDLADPAHEGQVCVRSSSNIYNISLMAGLVSHLGAQAAQDWAAAVVKNLARPPQSNDTGNIEAVAAGTCGVSIINTYYLARYAGSDDPKLRAIADRIGIVFPNQASFGTHVNISGAALVKGAPNAENAVKFLEYLASDTAQAYFANGNNEYPVVAGIAPNSAVQSLGAFKEDALNVSALGANQAEAVRIFDRAGWL